MITLLAARINFGFSNPNDAAALLTLLALFLLWPIAWRPWLAWACVPLALAAALGACATASRGAAAALLAALLVMFISQPALRALAVARWKTSLLLTLALTAMLAATPVGPRLHRLLVETDRSLVSRWEVYRTVPAMIAAAPDGWGRGQAGAAWRNWFQPEGRTERFLHLLSTHATVMVELSHGGRIAYLGGWLLLLALFLPRRSAGRLTRSGLPLATLTAAAVLGAVNHPYLQPQVLATALALLTLACAIELSHHLRRWRRLPPPSDAAPGPAAPSRPRPIRRAALTALTTVAAAALMLGGIVWTGRLAAGDPVIRADRHGILIGDGPVRLLIVEPPVDIVGRAYGHQVRQLVAGDNRAGSVLILRHPPPAADERVIRADNPWPQLHTVLLADTGLEPFASGLIPPEQQARVTIKYLNPRAAVTTPEQALAELEPLAGFRAVEIHWGAFRQGASSRPWRQAAAVLDHVRYRLLETDADYVGNFLQKTACTLNPPDLRDGTSAEPPRSTSP